MSNKKDIVKKFGGELIFTDVDPIHARFEMAENDNLLGARRLQMPVDILPEDYEPEKYDVKGKFGFEIIVVPKK